MKTLLKQQKSDVLILAELVEIVVMVPLVLLAIMQLSPDLTGRSESGLGEFLYMFPVRVLWVLCLILPVVLVILGALTRASKVRVSALAIAAAHFGFLCFLGLYFESRPADWMIAVFLCAICLGLILFEVRGGEK